MMDAIYTDTGQGNANTASWNAIAIGTSNSDVHSYFAITDTGEGIVFHSPMTNGGKVYLNQRTTRNFKKNLHSCFINKKENKLWNRLFFWFCLSNEGRNENEPRLCA